RHARHPQPRARQLGQRRQRDRRAPGPGRSRDAGGVRPAPKPPYDAPRRNLVRFPPMPATPDYPRDLTGYGRNPPHADWPGGARIAVQFVLNLEEGSENCVLHGDPGSEQFLSEIIGAATYPSRHLSMESLYEYGSRVGAWRILREFERRD